MHCVNITICRCQLIGIDYGNEGKRVFSAEWSRGMTGVDHLMIFLSSHRVTIWRGGLSQYLVAVVCSRL